MPYAHTDRVPFAENRVSAENAGPSRDVSSRIRSPALQATFLPSYPRAGPEKVFNSSLKGNARRYREPYFARHR